MATNRTVFPIIACLSTFMVASVPWGAACAAEHADLEQKAALIKVLPQSKITLAEGLKRAAKGNEVPVSAKFEFDDSGKLSLSIYTAEKGLATDPEHNVLKELSGSPSQDKWTPETEVFKDIPHVARASEQLTLMRLSKVPLVDIVINAQKQYRGTVFSVTPAVKNHQPVLVVLDAANDGKVVELNFSLLDGKLMPSK